MQITLKTLTPLWTGGIDGNTDRLHETGIIGSLRWWYEALVRGLGGYACNPTSDNRCEYDPKKSNPPEKQLCAACYLFGCTGWGRRFRLRVLDTNGQLVQNAIQKDAQLTLAFVELRPINLEEQWLLVKAVEIAAKYGALGGKTTLKPQKGKVGEDYGIVQWIGATEVQKPTDIAAFLQGFRQDKHPPQYPNLQHFFFFNGAFLSRPQMNPLLGLNEKGKRLSRTNNVQMFLQGARGSAQQNAVSKKLFSFRMNGGRIWGYAKDHEMRDEIIARIKQQLGNAEYAVKTGEEVFDEL